MNAVIGFWPVSFDSHIVSTTTIRIGGFFDLRLK